MLYSLRHLDRLLRGDATKLAALRFGRVELPLADLALLVLVLGLFYGLCMACYAIFNSSPDALRQIAATMLKVPLLFFLTLFITFPSLYVFNGLIGSRLEAGSVLRLMIATLAVMTAILASLGPIVAFFSASTTSYSFMLLLNVAVFAVAGALGLRFLFVTLHKLTVAQAGLEAMSGIDETEVLLVHEHEPAAGKAHSDMLAREIGGLAPEGPASEEGDETGDSAGGSPTTEVVKVAPKVKLVFTIWVGMFSLVGAQLGWVMRPFLGNPNQPFEWFRPRESNFFEAVIRALGDLLS